MTPKRVHCEPADYLREAIEAKLDGLSEDECLLTATDDSPTIATAATDLQDRATSICAASIAAGSSLNAAEPLAQTTEAPPIILEEEESPIVPPSSEETLGIHVLLSQDPRGEVESESRS